MRAQSNTKDDPQNDGTENSGDPGSEHAKERRPSNYYYDDSTGYEIYKDNDEEDDESNENAL